MVTMAGTARRGALAGVRRSATPIAAAANRNTGIPKANLNTRRGAAAIVTISAGLTLNTPTW
jgi:hypothetical protein